MKWKQAPTIRRFSWVLVTVMLFVLPGICGLSVAAAETSLQKALWSPQAQFAGYYVALEKGFYARHGIDLTILEGGPGHSSAQALQDGTADFAVLWLTTALQLNDSGHRIVNLA